MESIIAFLAHAVQEQSRKNTFLLYFFEKMTILAVSEFIWED